MKLLRRRGAELNAQGRTTTSIAGQVTPGQRNLQRRVLGTQAQDYTTANGPSWLLGEPEMVWGSF